LHASSVLLSFFLEAQSGLSRGDALLELHEGALQLIKDLVMGL
jgi:hypothetical protein